MDYVKQTRTQLQEEQRRANETIAECDAMLANPLITDTQRSEWTLERRVNEGVLERVGDALQSLNSAFGEY